MPDVKGAHQTAALPWRRAEDGAVEVLLITSRETGRWVIPKGWPMAGKSGAESAAQEAYEEAGVRGEVSPLAIGAFSYDKVAKSGAAKRLTVFVFPLEVRELLEDWPERGQRTREWFPTHDAALRVNEPELQALIAAFVP
jgi:8-oxo-dGTP pyrophosphatase MutT (NUDIX family)